MSVTPASDSEIALWKQGLVERRQGLSPLRAQSTFARIDAEKAARAEAEAERDALREQVEEWEIAGENDLRLAREQRAIIDRLTGEATDA